MEKKRDDMLRKSTADLPVHQAPEEVWERISSRLDAAYHKLTADPDFRLLLDEQQHEAPEIWADIENALDENILSKAIRQLPHHTGPLLDIDELAGRKEEGNVKVLERTKTIYWWSAAAAVLLFIGVFLNQQGSNEALETLTYSEEIHSGRPIQDDLALYDDDVLGFIAQHCEVMALKCTSDKFRGLLDQYVELDTARNDLLSEIEANENQSRLVVYLSRVEKEQIAIGKELIQILMS